jgi:ribosome-binding ATPase YchF (GTP1/OBG family)
MKISVFSIPSIAVGKHNVKDARLDQVDKLVKAKKKTYVQVEVVGEEAVFEADAVLVSLDVKTDLILRDLEFVETRVSRTQDAQEKLLLEKLKSCLEKEELIHAADLTPQERQSMSSYSLVTNKPVITASAGEQEDTNALLAKALAESGYISFFTAGEKETRAWLIRQGSTAWDASGAIHSDIQKGFIRAEIIAFQEYIAAGGETPAKQAGKLRLEQKGYLMQDADLVMFRFNK